MAARKHVRSFVFEEQVETPFILPPQCYLCFYGRLYDVANPDTKKFPALEGVEGTEVFLEHGDTLFMPTGYWHWMKYIDGSYSLSLRAWDASLTRKAASLYNLAMKGGVDSLLKMAFKGDYARYREKVAAIKWADRRLWLAGKPL